MYGMAAVKKAMMPIGMAYGIPMSHIPTAVATPMNAIEMNSPRRYLPRLSMPVVRM